MNRAHGACWAHVGVLGARRCVGRTSVCRAHVGVSGARRCVGRTSVCRAHVGAPLRFRNSSNQVCRTTTLLPLLPT
ncbi:MAG: hypothetical protein RLP02_20195 [Coleofasciculus sp. C2-GNP5-27]